MKGYPLWFSKNFIATVLAVVFISGVLLIPTTFVMRFAIEVPWRLEVASRVWTVLVHVLGGLLLIAITGALWSVHMRVGWRQGLKRLSGGMIVGLIALLSMSGTGIYYISDARLLAFNSLVHLLLGLLICAAYLAHL